MTSQSDAAQTPVRVLDTTDLSPTESGFQFQGQQVDASVSVIVIDILPGEGPKLHRHPYEEVFVVLEGRATYTAGESVVEVGSGQVVVVPGGVPHAFINSGTGRLLQVDIHPSDHFITEWLE